MAAKTLSIYDPAMCCPTGVCGPDIDPSLVRFTADLAWLAKQGVEVKRFNLAQQPGAFVTEPTVKGALDALGEGALPMSLIDGHTVMSGTYPTREQLAGWFGLTVNAQKSTGCSPKSGCC